MKTKRLWTLIGSICLTLVLAALLLPACAPVEVPEEIAKLEAEIADLEDDVAAEKTKTAAEKAKVSDLEKEIAALKKPAEVYRWEPATWIGAGPQFANLEYVSEYVDEASDGRLVMQPSAPGAICPVDQQAEAVGDGLTPAMAPAGTYYGGKIPMTGLYGAGVGLPNYHEFVSCFQVFKDGRVQKILFEEYEKMFNVAAVGEFLGPQDITMGSTVPIDSTDNLDGLKFRCGDEAIAGPLAEFGAATTWIPAPEVYTALATGVFDAFTMGSAADDYALAFHEVTTYWLKSPKLMVLYELPFLVNRDVWNDMPEDLQELVKVAIVAADHRGQLEAEMAIDEAWELVVDYGIILTTWSEADTKKWVDAQFKWAKSYEDKDPNSAELMNTVREYRKFKGYD